MIYALSIANMFYLIGNMLLILGPALNFFDCLVTFCGGVTSLFYMKKLRLVICNVYAEDCMTDGAKIVRHASCSVSALHVLCFAHFVLG